jgi:hypothetical protein
MQTLGKGEKKTKNHDLRIHPEILKIIRKSNLTLKRGKLRKKN